jgi:predicted Zn-dependent protease
MKTTLFLKKVTQAFLPVRRLFCILCLFPILSPARTPEIPRPQQERLNRILLLAETDPPAALLAAEAIPAAERDPLLWRWLGDQFAAAETWPASMEAYEAALAAAPDYHDALLNHAVTALSANQPARAIPFLQNALSRGLQDARIYEALAAVGESSADPVLAEAAYRQALLLQADNARAREGLIRSLLTQTRYSEAELLLRPLIDSEPTRGPLWRLYADLALAQNRPETALIRIEAASRLGAADLRDQQRRLELYIQLERPDEVLRVFREGPELRSDLPFRLRLARALLQRGHLDPAREVLKDLPDPPPDLLAHIALLDNRPLEAFAHLEGVLRDKPLDPEALRMSGEALLAAERPRDAVPFFERLSRQPGQQARGLWMQGIAEARTSNIPRAIELLEAAQRIEDLPGLRRSLDQLRRL